MIARTGQLNTFMKGFADVFRLPAPARQPCELVGILERVVALISARPEAQRIAWRWELDTTAIRVSAYSAQLEQALLNVVKNAVEAIGSDGAGGTVTIGVTSKTDLPTLVVEDSGAGLTAEAQANLFTPFFSTKPGGQGIGRHWSARFSPATASTTPSSAPIAAPRPSGLRFPDDSGLRNDSGVVRRPRRLRSRSPFNDAEDHARALLHAARAARRRAQRVRICRDAALRPGSRWVIRESPSNTIS